MKTREILTTEKSEVINNEIARLNEYSSYKEGLRDARTQALKYYEADLRSINAQRWFKIIKQSSNPTVIWSHNASLTMIVYDDGNFKYDDEIEGNSNYCRVVGASSTNFIPFYGTIMEAISAVKNNNFTHKKEGLLSPVEFFA
jgi:hypothetical protein